MLGDAGCDSQKLRNKLLNTNFGKLLTPKDKKILNLKLSPDNKKLLKNVLELNILICI